MKNQTTWIIIGVIALYAIIYFAGQQRKQSMNHPTLSSLASEPDSYLKNVEYYEEKDRHSQSAFNLEEAIQSIWKLEKDVDEESFERLESAIQRLEVAHKSIIRDSIDLDDLRATFEFTLNNLAHAELEIAEMYAETNHMNEANKALKYAQLHVKNAMLFHHSIWDVDATKLAIEKQVFEEMDSLINNKSISPMEYALALDKMIKEVDEVLTSQTEGQ